MKLKYRGYHYEFWYDKLAGVGRFRNIKTGQLSLLEVGYDCGKLVLLFKSCARSRHNNILPIVDMVGEDRIYLNNEDYYETST